ETDALFDKKPPAELERVAQLSDPRKQIERAVRLRDCDTGHPPQGVEAEVAIRFQAREHRGNFVLARSERNLGRLLGDAVRAGYDELIELGRFRRQITPRDQPAHTDRKSTRL